MSIRQRERVAALTLAARGAADWAMTYGAAAVRAVHVLGYVLVSNQVRHRAQVSIRFDDLNLLPDAGLLPAAALAQPSARELSINASGWPAKPRTPSWKIGF